MRDLTRRDIAQAWTDHGIKTPRGGDVWSQVTVMRVIGHRGKVKEKADAERKP